MDDNDNDNSSGSNSIIYNDNLVVYLSIVLTLLSLLSSLTESIVIILSINKEYNSKVMEITKIEFKFCLKSISFVNQHAYCHSSISECIMYIFKNCTEFNDGF